MPRSGGRVSSRRCDGVKAQTPGLGRSCFPCAVIIIRWRRSFALFVNYDLRVLSIRPPCFHHTADTALTLGIINRNDLDEFHQSHCLVRRLRREFWPLRA